MGLMLLTIWLDYAEQRIEPKYVAIAAETCDLAHAHRTAASTFANLHEDVKQVWREGALSHEGVVSVIKDGI